MEKGYWSTLSNHRIQRRRALAVSGSAALVTALLAACGTSQPAEPGLVTPAADTSRQAKRGGVLKHSIATDGGSFDLSTQNLAVAPAVRMANTVLLRFAPSILAQPTTEILPDLAESWEFSPDRTQLTMKLRPGVKWHNKAPVNGRTLDMDDVRFSIERAARLGGSRTEIFAAANPQAPVGSITYPDSTTIVVKLQRPVYYTPALFANNIGGRVNIVPKETDSTFDIRRDMIGTGPYVLTNYATSVGYTFRRNPEFYDKSAGYIDEVEMPIVPEYSAALAQFRRGNLYVFEGMRAEDVLPVKQDIPELNLY